MPIRQELAGSARMASRISGRGGRAREGGRGRGLRARRGQREAAGSAVRTGFVQPFPRRLPVIPGIASILLASGAVDGRQASKMLAIPGWTRTPLATGPHLGAEMLCFSILL